MPLKTLIAATLLALLSSAFAQTTSTDAQTSTDTPSGASVGGVDLTNKCVGMMGAEREKCLLDQRSGASSGATTGATTGPTTATPGIATTAPAPLATPSSPTNPTTLPGSSTTPSGK
jgi:hypothetical protein